MKTAVATIVFAALACGPQADRPEPVVRASILPDLTTRRAASPENEPIQVRRLLADDQHGNFYAKTPSPDGGFVTEIDWSTGDLAIQDLETGTLRRVTDKGPWSRSGDYAEASAFSPDGRRIVYTWFSQAAHGYELRVINVDGTGMRVLVPASEATQYFEPRHWSRDGRWIPITRYRRDGANQIALVSAEDGTVRVLKTVDWRAPLTVTMSPDGRFVAYDFPPEERERQRDIYVLDADGSREARVVTGSAHDRFLGWLPDGSGILYYSDRGVWLLPMRDGRPSGERQLVRSDVWNLIPQGMTQRGYVYGVQVSNRQVHTATVDLAAGRVVGSPTPVTSSHERASNFGAWSPDGARLAFVQEAGFTTILAVQERDAREQRELILQLAQPQGLQWAPDGQSVFLFAKSPRTGDGLYQVSLRTGEAELVARFTGDNGGSLMRFELARDGRSFYTRHKEDSLARGSGAAQWIVRRDLRTGERHRVQRTYGVGGRIGLSPDGRLMAYGENHWGVGPLEIRVVPVTGGTSRIAYTFPDGHQPIGNRATLLWTPDGRHILFPEQARQDSSHLLRMVPVDGGESRTLLHTNASEGPIWNVRLSPDGRRIAYTGGAARAEIWLLSGFENSTEPAGSR